MLPTPVPINSGISFKCILSWLISFISRYKTNINAEKNTLIDTTCIELNPISFNWFTNTDIIPHRVPAMIIYIAFFITITILYILWLWNY